MKVGIITIFAVPNYGAMLQAYALSSFLQDEGFDAEVVDYRQPALDEYFRYRLKFPPAINHWLRLRNCRAFVEQKIRRSPQVLRSPEELAARAHEYDAFITGSDQVWFTGPVQYYDNAFFLDFPANGCRRISYAASVGGTTSFGEFEGKVRTAVRKIDHLGVRDPHTESVIAPLAERKPTLTVDPTFLHDFRALLSERPPVDEPYVLLFGDFRGALENTVRQVQQLTGVKRVVSLQYPCNAATHRIAAPGPEQWLNWFRHARFVVTSYFHGTAFAVNFQRPFIAIPTPGRKLKVATLLEPLGLVDRCFMEPPAPAAVEAVVKRDIDWNSVAARLRPQVDASKEFLRTALK